MFPSSRSRALAKEAERQRQLKEIEERNNLHAKLVKFIEEDDLDELKQFVPSVVPLDEVFQEFILYLWPTFLRGKV